MKRLALMATAVVLFSVPGLPAAPALALHDTPLASAESAAVSGPASGYQYRKPETRAIQDDDDINSAFLWIENGAEAWTQAEGAAGKACASCHGRAEETMKGVGDSYPKYHARRPASRSIWSSGSTSAAPRTCGPRPGTGRPTSCPARPFFEAGKSLFHKRLGQIDMACSHCHDGQVGRKPARAGAEPGHRSTAFPPISSGFQRVVSVNFLFRFCNSRVRAAPYDFGSEEYIGLELYTTWRGQGLPVETPAVR